ncbi:MAG: gamma-butyrobetaine hydroxylase-like domain-containing protein [Methyloligellaceae bacterium]
MIDNTPWPTEIRLNKDKNELTVTFGDAGTFHYTAEFLRVNSPSAEVQGHSPDQRQTVPGKKHVLMANLEQVGNYAVRIRFDDGHDTGLYSWSHLYELGTSYDDRWADYLRELAEKGLSRA